MSDFLKYVIPAGPDIENREAHATIKKFILVPKCIEVGQAKFTQGPAQLF